MKKNLVYGLLALATLSISLNSCRTDEMLTGTEQAQKEKIAFFERFEKERSLSKNAESNNYALPFANSMLAYFSNYPEKKTELENKYGTVDLSVSSQDMDLENGRKLLIFPMLTDGKVTAVIGGVINEKRDFLYFDVYKDNHPDRSFLIKTFQNHYSAKTVSRNDSNNPINVGDVIIIVKKPQLTKPDPFDDPGGNGGHDMGGGNGDFTDGGSGGNNPNTPNNTNPCEQTKKMIQDSKIENIVKDLKDHLNSGTGGEKGWRDNKTGPPTPTPPNGQHSVVFGDPSTMNGGYHNHTGTTVDIFSATDIDTFLDIVRYQNIGNMGNAYFGIVAPNDVHYIMHFNGNHADIPPAGSYSEVDITVWNIAMLRSTWNILNKDTSGVYCNKSTNRLNSKGLEKVFFDTLKKMGLENKVTLQKVDSNNKIATVIKKNDGTTTDIPCPQ
ncbi:hypothetical protein [Chryseobacterium aurantiacum]|uniref:hypothetical protein n=1 Tax=Chryseobacterium aurantiacum TaxID=2116499 RepID=UPI0013C5145A|nr:hypothetical protein [Chryseobacterium aurantiacum]